MTYEELVQWAENQGRTLEDIKRYRLWDAANYFADLNVYDLYHELVEGDGVLNATTEEGFATYVEESDDEAFQGIKDSMTGFWNEFDRR